MGVYSRTGPLGIAYWIRYQVHGRRVKESLGPGSTRREAEALLHRRISEARHGRPHLPHGAGDTVAQLLDRYLAHCAVRGLRSVRSMRSKCAVILRHRIASRTAANLTQADFEGYVRDRLARHGSTPPPAPATVNRELGIMRAALRWAARRGEVQAIPHVQLLREPPGRVRYLSEAEEVALLRAAAPRLRALLVLALQTGCRAGELLGLRWGDVDLQGGVVHVERSAPGGRAGTKGGGRRDVPLSEGARAALVTLRGMAGEVKGRELDAMLVVCTADGGPYQNVQRDFGIVRRRAGLDNVRFHDCRHTVASRMAMGGIPLAVIRDLLGHSTIRVTERYAHLTPGAVRDAVAGLQPPAVAPDLAPRAEAV